jgi:hypothetical protein
MALGSVHGRLESSAQTVLRSSTLVLAAALLSALGSQPSFGQTTSTWVHYDRHGRLEYATDAQGNRILDYSSAGYEGGGVTLPCVPARATVHASGGDDTAAIQSAIDTVSALPADKRGIRGAVLLAPGSFKVSATLKITTGGVVLAGSGSDANGSVITMTGSPFTLLSVSGSGSYTPGTSVAITDAYVPSGAESFHVSDASGFKVGDAVLVSRPVTSAWIAFMGMDKLVRDGKPQTWIPAGTQILTDRTITHVTGNQITLDAPLTDSFDSQYLNPIGGSIAPYTFPGRITQVGIEHLSIVAPAQEVSGTQYEAVEINNVQNGWLRDLNIHDTESTIVLGARTKAMTLEAVNVIHSYAQSNSAAPFDFSLSGTQVLVNKCSVTGHGNTWPFAPQARVTGPIVVLNSTADDRGFDPHQRWATGLLCDLCNFPNSHTADKSGVSYSNRGYFGSGHGWDAGWSVAWNATTTYLLIQAPPGVDNWCIGCIGTVLSEAAPGGDGTILPNGIFESLGTPVTPGSLYLAQLKQRLGMRALHRIGYADVNGTPFTGCARKHSEHQHDHEGECDDD